MNTILKRLVNDYTSEMEYSEGMESHPSDYFTDTTQVIKENFPDLSEDEQDESKEALENAVIANLRK